MDDYQDTGATTIAKTIRCVNFSENEPPRCYYENTSKEELVLEHVLEYKRQFKVIYEPTRKLLLAPRNECGKRKFICTTIRPTKLPYTELYEWEKCSKFIADFLEYEELTVPDKLPTIIPSPANVLNWQAGDSFDFAIVLCSLLIGCGYDAYVVYGTAPKEITTKDESLMDCPFPLDMPENEEEEDPEQDHDEEQMKEKKESGVQPLEDFQVQKKGPHMSEFDTTQMKKAQQEAQEKHLKAVTIDDDQPDFEKEDEYGQSRLHCWVLMQKGNRMLPETFFIEPTTGRKYSIQDAPYYSVEAVFNHKNFWINLDPNRPIEEINFDIQEDQSGEWEYVMIQTGDKKNGGEDDENGEGAEDEEDDDEEGGQVEEVLDMPPPWSPKLFVNKDKFLDLCPNGEKTVFYKKCKVDFYSECNQVDGLIKRITIYEDYKRLIIKEIRSYYKNRRDKLILRRRFPYQFKLVEHYESSEKSAYWKKLIQIDGRVRKIYFYHHRNKDGLIYREEQIGHKTFERYKGREDKLVYRSVTFTPDKRPTPQNLTILDNHYHKECVILKMSQRFALDPDLPAEQQIRKTEFNLDKGKVYIYYHFREGKIISNAESFDRKDLINQGRLGDMNEKDTDEDKTSQLHKRIIKMEQKCHEQIKEHEKIAQSESNQRSEGEKLIQQQRSQPDPQEIFSKVLEKSIYVKARDKMKQGKKKEEEENDKEQEKDYLLPILKKLSLENTELDEEAAINVKNEALRNLKERLLTRAEIIQRRLEDEQKNLEAAYANLKRKGENITTEDEQRYEKEVSKANFRIEILTERASQHYRNSLKKFEELDAKLMDDPRLKVLKKKTN